MPEKTLFQKILDGDLESELVWEDDLCGAFKDINPQAPTHILVVPRKPITGIDQLDDADAPLVGHLFTVARKIAEREGLDGGYRLVFNVGTHGQQTVPHLHLHLIGGRQLSWPPG